MPDFPAALSGIPPWPRNGIDDAETADGVDLLGIHRVKGGGNHKLNGGCGHEAVEQAIAGVMDDEHGPMRTIGTGAALEPVETRWLPGEPRHGRSELAEPAGATSCCSLTLKVRSSSHKPFPPEFVPKGLRPEPSLGHEGVLLPWKGRLRDDLSAPSLSKPPLPRTAGNPPESKTPTHPIDHKLTPRHET